MLIYHFIYKTVHTNGNYYYGRHSTTNLNYGYLGSGTWIKNIKKTSNLTREILEYSDSIENLKILESKYLEENYGKSGCMNRTKDTDGYTSEQSRKIQKDRVENGTHHLLSGEIQSKYQKKKYENGTHPWCSSEYRKKMEKKITENNGWNINIEQRRESAYELVKKGTHPFLDKQKAKKRTKIRMENGTHNCLTQHKCNHCGKEGQGPAMLRHHFNNCKQKDIHPLD